MPDHRIRLTDRDLVLARSAVKALCWAMLPMDKELSREYGQLGVRLTDITAGGQTKAVRQARKRALQEPNVR
jgi:hypothetical protein